MDEGEGHIGKGEGKERGMGKRTAEREGGLRCEGWKSQAPSVTTAVPS